jgi:hypothetical protein
MNNENENKINCENPTNKNIKERRSYKSKKIHRSEEDSPREIIYDADRYRCSILDSDKSDPPSEREPIENLMSDTFWIHYLNEYNEKRKIILCDIESPVANITD